MNTTRLTHTRFVILSIVLSGGIFVDDLSPPRALAGGVPYGDSSVVSATASVFVAPTPAQIGSDQTSPQNISKRPDNDRLVDRYDWQAWTTQDGLPQNSVSDIVQTRDGYLWLATFGGLARFDGVRFKVYDLSNTEALTSNRILSLLEDRNGNLWIGTQGVGVVRLRDGVFTSFHNGVNAPRGEVWSIVEDRDGIVWFGGRNLVRYADGQFEAAGPDEWMKRNRQVWSLFVDREQSLWVATSNGLGRLRDGQWRVFQVADGLPSGDIRFVHEDARGLLWARSIDRLCYFDGDKFIESLVQGERPSWIFAAAVDGRGDYWVGSGNGLFHARPMRKEGDDSSDRTLFQRAIERSVAGRVRALLEDREGNIWVGTDGDGLLRIRAAAFKPITPPSGFDAGSAVRALAGDGSGGLWIHFGGRNIVHLQDDEWKKLPANDDIGQIHSIKSGGHGTLWIRHGRKRLSKFRDGHFTQLEQGIDQFHGFFVDRNGIQNRADSLANNIFKFGQPLRRYRGLGRTTLHVVNRRIFRNEHLRCKIFVQVSDDDTRFRREASVIGLDLDDVFELGNGPIPSKHALLREVNRVFLSQTPKDLVMFLVKEQLSEAGIEFLKGYAPRIAE